MDRVAQNCLISNAASVPASRFALVGLPVIASVWLVVVCAGLACLWRYSNTPGELEAPPSTWPSRSSIQRRAERATLLVFVHPYCPCSRATLSELERLLTHCRRLVDTHVVFFQPSESASDWKQSDLWSKAAGISGVTTVADEGMRECDLFSAKTSGVTLLYDRHGALQFHGGITSSRGHEGDNTGQQAIELRLFGRDTTVEQTPVFGCCLRSRPSAEEVE